MRAWIFSRGVCESAAPSALYFRYRAHVTQWNVETIARIVPEWVEIDGDRRVLAVGLLSRLRTRDKIPYGAFPVLWKSACCSSLAECRKKNGRWIRHPDGDFVGLLAKLFVTRCLITTGIFACARTERRKTIHPTKSSSGRICYLAERISLEMCSVRLSVYQTRVSLCQPFSFVSAKFYMPKSFKIILLVIFFRKAKLYLDYSLSH